MSHPHSRIPSGMWACQGLAGDGQGGFIGIGWLHAAGLFVISALDTTDNGPEWHVSVTMRGGRCDDEAIALVRRDFDLVEAEEDNHLAGQARHLWLPVNPDARAAHCKCKEEGERHEERDGYVWTEAKP
jgi:hypothetical protein